MNSGDVISTVVLSSNEKRYGIFVNMDEIVYLKPIVKQVISHAVIVDKRIEHFVVRESLVDFAGKAAVHKEMDVSASNYTPFKTVNRAEKMVDHCWTPIPRARNQSKAFIRYIYYDNPLTSCWKEYIVPAIGTGIGFFMGGWFGSVVGASIGAAIQEKLFG